MVSLPPPSELIKRAQALAVLDLILSPEWEDRYYSFNSEWAERQVMASMRNGSGDEWCILFDEFGWAALRGLAHESPAWAEGGEELSQALQSACPPELSEFVQEPAFRWDATAFCYFWQPETGAWIRANDLTPFAKLDAGEAELFVHLTGTAEDYQTYAREYFEREIPIEMVRHIFEHKPIDVSVVAVLNPDTDFDEIEIELCHEIGYFP